jgi:hypothetical protein
VHVACTEYLTLLRVGDRSAATIDAGGVLAAFTGVLVRDGYAGYEHLQAVHAWCGAHLLAGPALDHHRIHRKRQDRGDLVPDTSGFTRVRYHVKCSQHATPDPLVVNSVDEVGNDRVDRRC